MADEQSSLMMTTDLIPARESSAEVLTQTEILDRLSGVGHVRALVGEAYGRRHAESTRRSYDSSWETFARWCENASARTVPIEGLGEFSVMSLIPRSSEQLTQEFPWDAFEQTLLLWLTSEFSGIAPEGVSDSDYDEWTETNALRSPATLTSTIAGIKSRASDYQPRLKWEPSSVFTGAVTGLRRSLASAYGAPRQATPLLLGHVEHIAEWLTSSTESPSVTADRLIFEFLMAGGSRADLGRFTVDCIDSGGERDTPEGPAWFPPAIRIPGRRRRGGTQDAPTVLLFDRHPALKAALDSWMRVRPDGDHILGTTINVSQRINDARVRVEKSAGVAWDDSGKLDRKSERAVRKMFTTSAEASMPLTRQRDHAALLVSFHGALRRSELCALRIADVQFSTTRGHRSATVTIQRSKTDQEGAGQRVYLHHSEKAPGYAAVVDVLAAWIDTLRTLGCEPGDSLFPVLGTNGTPRRVGTTTRAMDAEDWSVRLSNYAFDSAALGDVTDPTNRQAYERVRGHSPRRGFVTTAILQGVDAVAISKQTRHANIGMIATYADEVLAAHKDWADALYGGDQVIATDEADTDALRAEIERLRAELAAAT